MSQRHLCHKVFFADEQDYISVFVYQITKKNVFSQGKQSLWFYLLFLQLPWHLKAIITLRLLSHQWSKRHICFKCLCFQGINFSGFLSTAMLSFKINIGKITFVSRRSICTLKTCIYQQGILWMLNIFFISVFSSLLPIVTTNNTKGNPYPLIRYFSLSLSLSLTHTHSKQNWISWKKTFPQRTFNMEKIV